MCYRRNPSLRNKLAKTRYIQELATPTNRPTLTPHCTNKCWNRKCPTFPNIPTRHQFLSTTLGTTHTTKCNYTCRSSGIVYLVSCLICHKQYLGQTLGSAGGLEDQVTTNDQKKWDGMGSPPGAVGKSGTPLPSTLLTD